MDFLIFLNFIDIRDSASLIKAGVYPRLVVMGKPLGSWPSVVTFEVDPKSNMAALASDWLTHCQLHLKNDWRNLLQACYKCSISSANQVWLLFKLIRSPIWPPWPLIGWHILNFFWRMAAGIYSELAINFPYELLTKCCCFLSRSKIKYGRTGLWLADTFSTSSHERLKKSTPRLPQMFFMRSQPNVFTF